MVFDLSFKLPDDSLSISDNEDTKGVAKVPEKSGGKRKVTRSVPVSKASQKK
jgi:hypothetical protein